MKYRIFAAFVTCLFLLSCKSKSSYPTESQSIGQTEYVVFPFYPNQKYPIFKNSRPANLSREEIIEIEKIIGNKVSEIIRNHNSKKKQPDVYVRQYVAAENSKGEKHVWINIFCSDEYTPWEEGIIDVSDGGDCAFQMKVNLSLKEIYEFRVNLIS